MIKREKVVGKVQGIEYVVNDMNDKEDKPIDKPIHLLVDPYYEPSRLPPIKGKLLEKMYEELEKVKDFIDPEIFMIIAKKLGIKYLTPGDYKRLLLQYPILKEAFIYDSENNVYFIKILE
ncbi:MAG: hypothetical protein ACP5G1_03640 [Nanopusillaceae archaeon]